MIRNQPIHHDALLIFCCITLQLLDTETPSSSNSREHSPPPSYEAENLLSLDAPQTYQPIIDDDLEPVMRGLYPEYM